MASPPHPGRTFASAPRCLEARLTWGLRVAARTLTWLSLLLPLLLLPPPPPALLLSEWESVGIRRRGNNDPCSYIAENLGGGASCGRWKQGNCGVRGDLENSRKAESARATWRASEPPESTPVPRAQPWENRQDRNQQPSSDHALVKGADFEGNLSRTTWAQLAYGKRPRAQNCTAWPGVGLLSMSSCGARRIGVSVLKEEPSAGGFRWLTPPPPRSPQVLFPPLVRGAETQEQGDLRGREASDMCQHIWGAHPKSPRGDLPKQFKLRY
ncbi:hypothetical protein A6R68_15865 [Neotoma lepida]|uniref:Uncharacterized protein n=1 Tax=Neotoma lepida TaxID=56216 RepID=A0A1A6H7L6_NEOLE|nr:hypothetical protein A6R68_15865 [Neotoma lepida]